MMAMEFKLRKNNLVALYKTKVCIANEINEKLWKRRNKNVAHKSLHKLKIPKEASLALSVGTNLHLDLILLQ